MITSQTTAGACRWCGCWHTGHCPSIKAIEYYPDGISVKRVEFEEPIYRARKFPDGQPNGIASGNLIPPLETT